jgi:hypothetical protein
LLNLRRSEEGITIIEHLRNAAADEVGWEKLSSIKYLIKQRIRDYIQLNCASQTMGISNNPYEESKATLLGDIHRVRRYFHYVTKTLKHIPYLDRQVVDLAIAEIGEVYDDDGNVLNTIHAYLKTFCLRNSMVHADVHAQSRKAWKEKRTLFSEKCKERRNAYTEVENKCLQLAKNADNYELRLRNVKQRKKQKSEAVLNLIKRMTARNGQRISDLRLGLTRVQQEMKSFDEEIPKTEKLMNGLREELAEQ